MVRIACGVVGFRGGVIDGVRRMDFLHSCWRILLFAAVDVVRNDWGIDIWPGRKGLGIGGLCLVFVVIGLDGVWGSGISSLFVCNIKVERYFLFRGLSTMVLLLRFFVHFVHFCYFWGF